MKIQWRGGRVVVRHGFEPYIWLSTSLLVVGLACTFINTFIRGIRCKFKRIRSTVFNDVQKNLCRAVSWGGFVSLLCRGGFCVRVCQAGFAMMPSKRQSIAVRDRTRFPVTNRARLTHNECSDGVRENVRFGSPTAQIEFYAVRQFKLARLPLNE